MKRYNHKSIIHNLPKSLALLLLLLLPMTAMAQYTITGSGTSFTVTKNGSRLGQANQTIYTVILAIKTNANKADVTIQFGNGTDELNIGTNYITFDGSDTDYSPAWGKITLSGKITGTGTGVVKIANGVSVESKADIKNTYNSNDFHAISNAGTLTISGGTISAVNGYAVYNSSADAAVVLSGAPNITKPIYMAAAGKLSVADFAPNDNTYQIEFAPLAYSNNMIVVKDGASFLSNFISANDAVNFETSGNDIILNIVNGYVVTSSQNSYVITRGASEFAAIQQAIDHIKTDANKEPCTIQFGDGTEELDIGMENITFDGGTSRTDWGNITLLGKITSANTNNTGAIGTGTIYMTNDVSIESSADIRNTYSGGRVIYNNGTLNITGGTVSAISGTAVSNSSNRTLNIIGGTISVTSGSAVSNSGTANITGGTVSATTSYAVSNDAGKITVSGTANITSANTNQGQGTIYLRNSGTATDVRLEITGGTVKNTATGNAVYNASTGAISISGGEVSATGSHTVYNASTGALNISDGTVSTVTGIAVYNASTGTVNITGGNISSTIEHTTYNSGTGEIYNTSSTAVYNNSSGALNISGGTISAVIGRAVYNSAGTVNISGGNISAASVIGYAIYRDAGTLVLSGAPDITGRIRGYFSVAAGFEPSPEQVYTIAVTSCSENASAVGGGASFIDNFDITSTTIAICGLKVSGNNLVLTNEVGYAWTKNGTVFTIDKVIGGTATTIQTVIDEIKAEANGEDCSIQFGNGINELSTGLEPKIFDGGAQGTDWGNITLLGKIASAASVYGGSGGGGSIYIRNGVSVESKADIKMINNDWYAYTPIINEGTGTLTISEGAISVTLGNAVYSPSSGTLNISGGTINSFTGGQAIYASGTVNISGGTISATTYAVYTGGVLNISGGTISADDYTVYSPIGINISGGTILTTNDNDLMPDIYSAGTIVLSGSPNIVGIICAKGGNLSVAAGFEPSQVYTIGYVGALSSNVNGYTENLIAVVGGANFIDNFKVYNYDNNINWKLYANGNDLLLTRKTKPEYTVPINITASYGTLLSAVELPTGWSLEGTGEVGNVGVQTHKATFTPSDIVNYNVVTGIDVEITVTKATPAYTTPTDLTAVYGDLLSSVELPEGWEWEGTGEVGNAGEQTHQATFTPEDTENYNIVTGIDVSVTVAKAIPDYTLPADLTAVYGDLLSSVELPEGWEWEGTGEVGNVGERTHKAKYLGSENYNAVSNIDVTVTVEKANPAAPTDLTATFGDLLSTVELPTSWEWESTGTVGNAGERTHKAKYLGSDNYNAVSNIDVTVNVAKANPTYTTPEGLTATYGEQLSSVTLTTGWSWEGTGAVGNVGVQTHKAKFTPSDIANYNVVSNIDVNVTVAKATPDYTTPTSLTATYGDLISSVVLPSGWSWDGSGAVGNAGVQTHKAKFTPSDIANYNVVSNVDVTITVAKAIPTYTVPTDLTASYGDLISSVVLSSGWSWEGTGTVGNAGVQTHKAKFTPSDIANYNVVSNIDVTITVAKATPTPTTLTGLTATYGDLLSSVELPEGWEWDNAGATVGNAGAQIHKAICLGSDNYNPVSDIDVTVTVAKATPNPTTPTDLTATYGDLLSSVELPEGWEWNNAGATVGNAGVQTHQAKFTPSDIANYNIVTKGLSVEVDKATLAFEVHDHDDVAETYALGLTLADIVLPEGYVWNSPETELNAGDNQKHAVTYIHSDNHHSVEGELIVHIAKADHDMTGISFDHKTVTHNGEEHHITHVGDLPEGVECEYHGNGKVEVGEHTVRMVCTSTNSNYNHPAAMEAILTIADGTTPVISANPFIGNIGVQTISGSIVLSNLPANAKVEVYNLSGKRINAGSLHATTVHSGEVRIAVPAKGMYIVKVGSQSLRVAVK